MNEKEKQYFAELTQVHSNAADVLSQSFLSGMWEGIVEKYSDQAHFIYELLQNADDVCATYANFTLFNDKLVFKHNGTRHFHVSDPKTEEQDRLNGKLGDLNSIASAAQSSKKGKDTIGKFGVGFKAVFQYTETPHIYDPNIAFKIEKFIVPISLDNDYQGRKEDETVFVFPFDHKERDACEAFQDIFDKLRNLVYPILFLKHLKDISFDVENDHAFGMYEKNCVLKESFGDISAQKLELIYTEGNDIVTDFMWLFSRKDDFDREYCVGFFFNEEGKLKPVNMPAFCYFPTKEDTKLNFIIHAPFLLTDSREGIKAGEEYNKNLVSLLAKLSADALCCLQKKGYDENNRIIDDEILDIVPFDSTAFSNINDKSKISFLPFYDTIKAGLKNGLLPTIDGHTDCEHSYWSNTLDINTLFSDEQLEQLINEENVHWVFRTKPRHALDSYGRTILRNYIDDIVYDWFNESDIFSNINASFIKEQSFEWLHKFYKWISDTPKRFTSYLKSVPIFIDAKGEPVAAYDENGQKTLFLPSMAVKDCPTINSELLKVLDTKSFLLDIVKLEEPSLQDYIYNTVIPNYQNDRDEDPFTYFKLFFGYYKECRATEIDNYIEKIKELDFLEYIDKSDECYYRCKARELYYPEEKLIEYFSAKPDTHFLALNQYINEYPNDTDLNSFLNELGVLHSPKTYSYELTYNEILTFKDNLPRERSTTGHKYSETRIDGCIELAEYIARNAVAEKSFLLWNMLSKILSDSIYINVDGRYSYFYYSYHTKCYKPVMAQKLQTEKWLINKDGDFVSADSIKLSDLSADYDTTSEAAKKLIEYLELEEEMDEPLTEEEKLGNICKKHGISVEDLIELIKIKRAKDLRDNPLDTSHDQSQTETQSAVDSIARDISKIAKNQQKNKENSTENPLGEMPIVSAEHEEIDRDEFTPGTVDYQSKIDTEKERQAEELQELAQMQELQDIALSTEKYSYLWFKTLLDMEILNSNVDSMNNREVNISFGKIEKEEGTQKTYVLNHPMKDGMVIFTARCVNGKVIQVWDERNSPHKPYGSYSGSGSTNKKDDDPYNATDYAHPEDFYYDHYDDFFDYEDAEDYYNEHDD